MKEVNEDALEPNIAGSENNLNSDGGGSSDNSGYHSDSDSTVMMSGNSPFISKSARYNFLSRSGKSILNFIFFYWVFNLACNVLPFAFTLTSGCKTPEVS